MHVTNDMVETEPLSDAHGQSKLEVWMNAGLKIAVAERADELDMPMAEYTRRVLRDRLGEGDGPREIEA